MQEQGQVLRGAGSPSSRRPARLSPLVHWLVTGLLLAAFGSGVLIWWGQTAGAIEDELSLTRRAPDWVRSLLVFHGCLYPLQCGLFGYLIAAHFHPGWKLRANRVSGLLTDLVFLGQILSGTLLYYAGDWRETIVWVHRLTGAGFPVVLGLHWWLGVRWAREAEAAA